MALQERKKKWFRIIKLVILIYCGIGIILYSLQEKILFHPQSLPADYTFKFNQRFEEIKIPFNRTDTVSMVKFYPADTISRGVVLYFHGNKRNVEHYARFAPFFTDRGYEVWMPDYPGFGKSTGERNEQKLYSIAYEVQRMAAVKFAAANVIVYGKSLGTAIAAYVGSIRPHKLLILETPYYSIPSLFNSYAFMYPASVMSNYKLPTHEFLAEVKAPVAIFHGTGDWVVPYRSGVRLKKFLKANDVFIRIPEGSHNNLGESVIYRRSLDSLLSL